MIIIITLPDFFEGETALVNCLFEQGMQRLHLRKPKATEQQMAEWIEHIARPFRHRIVLHDHHNLVMKYNLGGVHLNSRNPSFSFTPLVNCEERHGSSEKVYQNFTISRSCHSIEELKRYKQECDYLFLSPIYDSISKEGYGAAFSRQKIRQAHLDHIIDSKVYALGGVTFDKLDEVLSMGFGGAAILGDLWLSESPLLKMNEFLSATKV